MLTLCVAVGVFEWKQCLPGTDRFIVATVMTFILLAAFDVLTTSNVIAEDCSIFVSIIFIAVLICKTMQLLRDGGWKEIRSQNIVSLIIDQGKDMTS